MTDFHLTLFPADNGALLFGVGLVPFQSLFFVRKLGALKARCG